MIHLNEGDIADRFGIHVVEMGVMDNCMVLLPETGGCDRQTPRYKMQ